MRNGVAFQHRRLALPTAAAGSSSSPGPVMPSPGAADAKGTRSPDSVSSRNRGNGDNGGPPRKLGEVVVNELRLPTPNASDWKGSGATQGRSRLNRGKAIARKPGDADLSEAVTMLLKTPTSQLAVNGGSQDPAKRKAGGHGPTLDDEVSYLLPTVVARDSGSSPESFLERKNRPGVTSLTIMAENGMIPTGARMSPPSAAGSESSAGQLPGQLSLDELESQG